jgi:hypothetical protein
MRDYEKAVQAMKRLMKPNCSEYEKALKAMKWLVENTETHYIDNESGSKSSKEQGGKFFVRIESSETVSGIELIEMAKELGWEE